jgi:hypothetical protein
MHTKRPRGAPPLNAAPSEFDAVALNSVVILKLLKDVKTLMANSTGPGSELNETVVNLTIAVEALGEQVDLLTRRVNFIESQCTVINPS